MKKMNQQQSSLNLHNFSQTVQIYGSEAAESPVRAILRMARYVRITRSFSSSSPACRQVCATTGSPSVWTGSPFFAMDLHSSAAVGRDAFEMHVKSLESGGKQEQGLPFGKACNHDNVQDIIAGICLWTEPEAAALIRMVHDRGKVSPIELQRGLVIQGKGHAPGSKRKKQSHSHGGVGELAQSDPVQEDFQPGDGHLMADACVKTKTGAYHKSAGMFKKGQGIFNLGRGIFKNTTSPLEKKSII